jgi:EmrB/QacA subfamily drug resistance transporter
MRPRVLNEAGNMWRVLAIVSGAAFMVSLDATAVVAAFPALRLHFGSVSSEALGWILNAYTLLYAALLVPAGAWADRVGRKRAFLIGLGVFTLSSLACALSPNVATLIAARAIQAAGAAALTPAALALVLESVPMGKRSAVVGVWGAVIALAAAVGPGLGSWLIDLFSWRSIFWINVPIGLVVAWRSARITQRPDAKENRARPDWFGSALLAAGFGALVAGSAGGASGPVLIAVGFILLAGCIAWSRRRSNATLDLSLFGNRNYRLANTATLIFGTAFGMMFLTFFVFMTGIWHFSQTRAGLIAMVGPLMVIPFAILSGRIAGRHGHRWLIVTGGLLFAAAQTWYAVRLTPTPDYLRIWLPGQLMSGAAIGLVLPSLSAAAVTGLPAARLAVGNAFNTAVRQLGSVFGVAIAVSLIGGAHLAIESFRSVYLLLAAAGVITAVVSTRIDTLSWNRSSLGAQQ